MTAVPYIGDLARKVANLYLLVPLAILQQHVDLRQQRKLLTYNPNIARVVGDSLGGSVALELQKHHPELKARTYGAPVVDLNGAVQPTRNTDTERYRNLGDPILMFDSSAHTTFYP